MDNNKKYDVIIIGTGPAGLSAAVYSARYNLKTLVFGEVIGGLASEAYEIFNFISYEKIKGIELSMKMKKHVESLGVEIKNEKIIELSKKDKGFLVKSQDNDYFAKKVILAMGSEKNRLEVKNENNFLGRGLSYCATCDAALFKNKIVGVVGGGDAALTSALLLSKFAEKVYIFYRRDRFFRAKPPWVEAVKKNEKIKSIFNVNVTELIGNEALEAVKLDNNEEIKLDGLFIEIGSTPNIELCEQLGVNLEKGYIKVDKKQRTNVEGVFAAGDITNNYLKQIITAAAEGAIASTSAYEELSNQ